jgi:Pyruvate/2-oxoacid:ferredoxin oxidoreductase delta subunit
MTVEGRAAGAAVITQRCQGCGACLLTCPEHAIRPGAAAASPRTLIVLGGRCTGCGECAEVCPADAIDLQAAVVSASSSGHQAPGEGT